MTTVNWEREPGEKVEEFVAALLLLEHPHGNLITPSRGDRGVDIRVWNPGGFDIYQVKRYTGPLTSRQADEIKNSWSAFVRGTLPALPVRSWTLVTPWDPTNNRLDWLAELTGGSAIRTEWMGRTNLDVLAAHRPSLVGYYFGDGGQQMQRLLADALQGGRELPRTGAAEDMLAAAVARQNSIATTLNQLDPFYRYELDIRTGRLRDVPWDIDAETTPGLAFAQYQQLDDKHYAVLRLIALSAESVRLRPIAVKANLEVSTGSPDHVAVEEFRQFGAPFEDVPGTVIEVTGPPGVATSQADAGLFRFMPVASSAAAIPDLEVRVVDADGSVLHAVDLIDVQTSAAVDGPGWYLSGRDRGGVVKFEFFINGVDGHTVQLTGQSLTGKTPNMILPALRLLADVRDGTGLLVAVRGGGAVLTPTWDMGDEPLARLARFHVRLAVALAAIQRHTIHRVTVPDVEAATGEDLDQIFRVGRLVSGEQIEATWSEIPLTVSSPDKVPPGRDEFLLGAVFPLTVPLDGQDIELDMRRRVLCLAARLANPMQVIGLQPGDVLRLVPGSTDRAIMAAVPADDESFGPATGR